MKKIAYSTFLAIALALAAAALSAMTALADAPLVTISGTVVSVTDEVLVLRTDKGNLTFDLDKSTEMPAGIAVGNLITVSYDSDDKPEDKMDARRIVMMTGSSTTATPVTPAPVATSQTSATTYEDESNKLPATASPLPLAGGSGLLALAGGLLLRLRARRK